MKIQPGSNPSPPHAPPPRPLPICHLIEITFEEISSDEEIEVSNLASTKFTCSIESREILQKNMKDQSTNGASVKNNNQHAIFKSFL